MPFNWKSRLRLSRQIKTTNVSEQAGTLNDQNVLLLVKFHLKNEKLLMYGVLIDKQLPRKHIIGWPDTVLMILPIRGQSVSLPFYYIEKWSTIERNVKLVKCRLVYLVMSNSIIFCCDAWLKHLLPMISDGKPTVILLAILSHYFLYWGISLLLYRYWKIQITN